MAEGSIKEMTVKEFRELGYLQELNRRFLHPLGLALEVTVDSDGQEKFSSRVWDYRHDPEGIIYGPGIIDPVKAKHIYDEQALRDPVRLQRLGFVIQFGEDGSLSGTRRRERSEGPSKRAKPV